MGRSGTFQLSWVDLKVHLWSGPRWFPTRRQTCALVSSVKGASFWAVLRAYLLEATLKLPGSHAVGLEAGAEGVWARSMLDGAGDCLARGGAGASCVAASSRAANSLLEGIVEMPSPRIGGVNILVEGTWGVAKDCWGRGSVVVVA